MNLKNFLWYTGIWTYPPLVALVNLIVQALELSIPAIWQYVIVWGLPLLYPIIITWTNIERQQRGQTDFSFAATYGLAAKDEKHSKAYMEAAYPDIPAQYASKIPTGLVLGKHKGKYAYCPIGKDGINAFCVGTPGSGKSVLLLGWLYSMMFRDEIAKKGHAKPSNPYNYFLVDIKGELFEKMLGIKAQDYKAKDYPDFHVVAPAVPESWGYDVFYKIHREGVTETEYIKAITDIADALVLPSGDNPYFSDNAKKILFAVLYHFGKLGYDFVPIIQTLMGGKSDGNYSPERRPIVEARDMMELRERGEAICFSYGHYIRCKKLRYFEDPYIAPILKRRQEELATKNKIRAQAESIKEEKENETGSRGSQKTQNAYADCLWC